MSNDGGYRHVVHGSVKAQSHSQAIKLAKTKFPDLAWDDR